MLNKFFLALLLCSSLFGSAKEHMLNDLTHIQEVFSVRYAPLQWKEQYLGWQLESEIGRARAKVEALENPTVKQFQQIVKEFFHSTADYHVSVHFYSTLYADLDFTLKSAEGRYFIASIDRNYLPHWKFAFSVGDEILSFNGIPIGKAVQQFKESNFTGGNTKDTEQALAETYFTHRLGYMGHEVPKGRVEIVGRNSRGQKRAVTLEWDHRAERICDPGSGGGFVVEAPYKKSFRKKKKGYQSFFNKRMVTPHWAKNNSHEMGAYMSFVPDLGNQLWKSYYNSPFYAYIFLSPNGKKVGYVRLPHYEGEREEVEEFRKIIELFEKETDALVIDQLNNPGGSAFYLYALASMLTDKPLSTPKHSIALTQDDLYMAVKINRSLEGVYTTGEAQEILDGDFDGYEVDLEFANKVRSFTRFIIEEWKRGNLVTGKTHLFGVDDVKPHPYVNYTKPIMILINSLDFSGGDFFPAIMQDNKRALVVGMRTAGAGGYVIEGEFPNRSGIKDYKITGSLAFRDNGDALENLGVTPDIALVPTAADLQHGYQEYKAAILNILENKVLAK